MATSTEIGSFQKPGPNGKPDRVAIFDSPAAANDSRYRQFFAPDSKYINLPIDKAMTTYAGPEENDTAAYIKHIEQATGLDRGRVLNSLTEGERTALLNAIRIHENTTPGDSVTSYYNLSRD
jgi:hypothetical protein